MSISRFFIKVFYLVRAFLVLIFGSIGMAGIPEDIDTWARWLGPYAEYANQDLARWIFLIISIALLASLHPWRAMLRKPNRNVENASPIVIEEDMPRIIDRTPTGLRIVIYMLATYKQIERLNGEKWDCIISKSGGGVGHHNGTNEYIERAISSRSAGLSEIINSSGNDHISVHVPVQVSFYENSDDRANGVEPVTITDMAFQAPTDAILPANSSLSLIFLNTTRYHAVVNHPGYVFALNANNELERVNYQYGSITCKQFPLSPQSDKHDGDG